MLAGTEGRYIPRYQWCQLTLSKFFEAGEFITRLEGLSKSPKAYTSVQCGPGPDDHVELNSDLVFGEISLETFLVLVITNFPLASESLMRAERGL